MKADAVIFDLDGVLVDSMPTHVKCWQQAFGTIGLSIAAGEFYRLEGMRGHELVRKILLEKGLPADKETISMVEKEKAKILAVMRKPEPLVTLEMLERIRIPRAVVSGSGRSDVDLMLEEAFGSSLFEAIVTADDVYRGKPDPAAFREAAHTLGVDGGKVMVVENAPLGALAARDAGMECFIALNNSPLPRAEFDGLVPAERIFETTDAVLRHLVRIGI